MATSSKTFVAKRVRTWHATKLNVNTPVVHVTPKNPYNCSSVGVVTTVNPCTAAIQKVAEMDKWCLVVVGDINTEADTYVSLRARFAPGKITYLSYKDQLLLPYKLVANTPQKHFSRKNIGFLYAIHIGANVIFDFDDDNEVIHNIPLSALCPTAPLTAVIRNSTSVYSMKNPYSLWKTESSGIWPRGFPLAHINAQDEVKIMKTRRNMQIGVVQSLANIDPDVDAIYRLSPRAALPLPTRFHTRAKGPVVYGKNVFAPWNAQATMFARDAMWAMLLPATVHGRVSDIWRSYISQALMWTVNQHVMFYDPFVAHARNAHNYMGDFMSERPLYETSEEFVRVLNTESTYKRNSLPGAVEAVYITMYEFGFIEADDVRNAQLWISDLTDMKYAWPQPHRLPAKVAIGILSRTGNVELRQAIRDTWLRNAPIFIDFVFLVDASTENIVREQTAYNDIYVLNSSFSGRAKGFGEKLYKWIAYALTAYPDAQLIGKMDDDVFMCPNRMGAYFKTHFREHYHGYLHGFPGVELSPSGHTVPLTRIDEMFVMISRNFADQITNRPLCKPFDPKCPADHLVDTNFGGTSLGAWAALLNFKPTPSRDVALAPPVHCTGTRLATNGIKTAALMRRLWDDVHSRL
jgi:hypothetical protein